jgi:hypothetical protein
MYTWMHAALYPDARCHVSTLGYIELEIFKFQLALSLQKNEINAI